MLETGFTLIEVAMLAGAIAFVTNWLALIPWRRARDQHWTECARLLHPFIVAASTISWVLPGILAIGISLVWPEDSPPWVLVAFAAAMGVMVATIPIGREIRPRICLPELIRQTLQNWMTAFATWFLFLGAIAVMPGEFSLECLGVFYLFLIFATLWQRFNRNWLSIKLSHRVPAPTRLQNIATETAARMDVRFRSVWLLRSPTAQAYADIRNRDLLFTERLLEILSDEEIAAVCAHELGHLSEPKSSRLKRWLFATSRWPWIFLKPLAHTFGVPAYVGLMLWTAGIQKLGYQISRKLEVRADDIAKNSVPDSAVYARALLRLYEDNLSPAVTSEKHKTHPDLYDRMLAAGVTPDFPRPVPSERMAWHGRVLSTVFWILLGILVIRIVGTANESTAGDNGLAAFTSSPEN